MAQSDKVVAAASSPIALLLVAFDEEAPGTHKPTCSLPSASSFGAIRCQGIPIHHDRNIRSISSTSNSRRQTGDKPAVSNFQSCN